MSSPFESKFENYDLPLHGVRLPAFAVSPEMKGRLKLSEDVDNLTFLRSLCLEGFRKLSLVKDSKKYNEYAARAKYELEVINELGFVDYILLVWEVINYCHANSIPVGMGRGSAAGSLVLFLIGVTKIDPIKYGLFFERFISRIRAKKKTVDNVTYLDGSLMCDVDMDICYYKRPQVLSWLEKRFEGQTCKILTLNTLSGKLLIKECGKIVGNLSESDVKAIADLIPKVHGNVEDIEEVYNEVEDFRKWADANPRIYKTALKLRNLVKNKSVHASAMLLSYAKVEDSCPTELSSSKEIVSSFDMNWSAILNVKLDLLGLRSVSVVDDVCKSVGIKLEDIDFNDPFIYRNLFDLQTPHGLFQVEADTVFRACKKIQPKNLEELSGVLAVARPGAMQFIDQYALYTTTGTVQSIHPFFDDVLATTGGLALYQEQLMKMANKIGFDLDESELIRRVVGKKKVDEVKEWKPKVYEKVKEKGLEPVVADILWKILEDSASYSFNKSHSIAYAALAAATVYLKFKYPQQFFLSLLKMSKHEPDPIGEIAKIHKELSYFNIQLLPPHILKSSLDFSLEGDDIRFGLLSIKGISDKSVEKLTKFIKKHQNKFEVFQGANEAKLPVGVLCALIQAGALSGLGTNQSRSKIVLEAQTWNLLKDETEKPFAMQLGAQYNYDLMNVIKALLTFPNSKGKPVIKASRFETIKRHYQPYLEIYQKNKKSERFANWYYERSLLGYNYYTTLREIHLENNAELLYIRDALKEEGKVCFMGVVKETRADKSKKGTKYYKVVVTDETSEAPVFLFVTTNRKTKEVDDKIERCKESNGGRLPKEENIVFVSGRVFEDAIFADKITIIDQEIYTRLGDLKSKDKKEEKEENTVDKKD